MQSLDYNKIKFAVRISLWAALFALGAFITIPFFLVPVTLQNFFILLAGFYEGPKIACAAALLYILAGLLGLPVFAGAVAGPSVLLGPSAGFLLAYPFAALIAGLAKNKSYSYYFISAIVAFLLIYLSGISVLILRFSYTLNAALLIILPFLLGDTIKILVAVKIAYKKYDKSK